MATGYAACLPGHRSPRVVHRLWPVPRGGDGDRDALVAPLDPGRLPDYLVQRAAADLCGTLLQPGHARHDGRRPGQGRDGGQGESTTACRCPRLGHHRPPDRTQRPGDPGSGGHLDLGRGLRGSAPAAVGHAGGGRARPGPVREQGPAHQARAVGARRPPTLGRQVAFPRPSRTAVPQAPGRGSRWRSCFPSATTSSFA